MNFNSYIFIIFLFFSVILFNVLPKKIRYITLLVLSYVFYFSWSKYYCFLLLGTTVFTYLIGNFIERKKERHNKNGKGILALGLTVTVGLLLIFKYTNFTIENINSVFDLLSKTKPLSAIDIAMPLGISFYTFQIVGYMVDVYKEKIKAEKNILKYALFVSFFPQIVSGPIGRGKSLIEQIDTLENKQRFDYYRTNRAVVFILYGYFLKIVLADRLSLFVTKVFDNPYNYGSTVLLLASLSYAIQLYADFAGYTYIAKGCGRLFGIELTENFNTPYFSTSIREFWRRWHISLSSWLKDYVYIPLGGSRCSKFRKYINILITFAVSGIWHGANWTFVLWGLLHGIYQIIGALSSPVKKKITSMLKINTDNGLYRFIQIVITFILVDIAWIFFNAKSVKDSFFILNTIFSMTLPKKGTDIFTDTFIDIAIIIFAIFVLLIFSTVKKKTNKDVDTIVLGANNIFKWLILIALTCAVIMLGKYSSGITLAPFIYYQF